MLYLMESRIIKEGFFMEAFSCFLHSFSVVFGYMDVVE